MAAVVVPVMSTPSRISRTTPSSAVSTTTTPSVNVPVSR
jgi:hypothetical protein